MLIHLILLYYQPRPQYQHQHIQASPQFPMQQFQQPGQVHQFPLPMQQMYGMHQSPTNVFYPRPRNRFPRPQIRQNKLNMQGLFRHWPLGGRFPVSPQWFPCCCSICTSADVCIGCCTSSDSGPAGCSLRTNDGISFPRRSNNLRNETSWHLNSKHVERILNFPVNNSSI